MTVDSFVAISLGKVSPQISGTLRGVFAFSRIVLDHNGGCLR